MEEEEEEAAAEEEERKREKEREKKKKGLPLSSCLCLDVCVFVFSFCTDSSMPFLSPKQISDHAAVNEALLPQYYESKHKPRVKCFFCSKSSFPRVQSCH